MIASPITHARAAEFACAAYLLALWESILWRNDAPAIDPQAVADDALAFYASRFGDHALQAELTANAASRAVDESDGS